MELINEITPAVVNCNGEIMNVNIKKIKYCKRRNKEIMYVYNMDKSLYEEYEKDKCKIVEIK